MPGAMYPLVVSSSYPRLCIARFRPDKLLSVGDYPTSFAATPLRTRGFCTRINVWSWCNCDTGDFLVSRCILNVTREGIALHRASAPRKGRREPPVSTSVAIALLARFPFFLVFGAAYRSDLIYMAHARLRKYTQCR